MPTKRPRSPRELLPHPIIARRSSPSLRHLVAEERVGGGSLPYALVDLGEHLGAVIVYGRTQADANARAQRIVGGWNILNLVGRLSATVEEIARAERS